MMGVDMWPWKVVIPMEMVEVMVNIMRCDAVLLVL
jgi:hypothetical protein